MSLKLYVDPVSQPARACLLFVRANKIPAEEVQISIRKGEHKTAEYAKVNKFQKIPAIVHEDFHLAESVAIMTYLAKKFDVPQHWYPTNDARLQARVDEFNHFQHLGLRWPITRALLSVLMPERLSSVLPTEVQLKEYRKAMEDSLDNFVKMFLDGTNFVAGDQISIADLMAVGELEMTRLMNVDIRAGRPKLAAYLDRVKDSLDPFYDEVHAPLLAAAESFKALLANK